jgi:hypothetical protein
MRGMSILVTRSSLVPRFVSRHTVQTATLVRTYKRIVISLRVPAHVISLTVASKKQPNFPVSSNTSLCSAQSGDAVGVKEKVIYFAAVGFVATERQKSDFLRFFCSFLLL